MAAKIDKEICTECGICVDVCPVEAIKLENDKAVNKIKLAGSERDNGRSENNHIMR